jgi:hypothetical protein
MVSGYSHGLTVIPWFLQGIPRKVRQTSWCHEFFLPGSGRAVNSQARPDDRNEEIPGPINELRIFPIKPLQDDNDRQQLIF